MGGRRGPRPLLHLRGTFGDSRHRLQSALSTLLGDGGEHVQTDVPCAQRRLRGQRGARIVQPTRAGDARSTGMSPYCPRVTRQGDLLHLEQRSPTCRGRVTEVEEAFAGRVGASYVRLIYQ